MILIAAASGEGSLQTLLKCLKELEDLFKQDPAEAPLVPPRNDCVIRCEKGGHAAAETWAGMTEEEAQLARHPPEAVPGPEEPLPPHLSWKGFKNDAVDGRMALQSFFCTEDWRLTALHQACW
ncbi:uncharacterized protein LOC143695334 isoform X2 [Agelaius phoeniceus]|uniref:uncharacterized protein LOC143695334 isoform X2 n=1 Tax=Agelaius phoeniceus TaxID=39638 RepID=UPI0040551C56